MQGMEHGIVLGIQAALLTMLIVIASSIGYEWFVRKRLKEMYAEARARIKRIDAYIGLKRRLKGVNQFLNFVGACAMMIARRLSGIKTEMRKENGKS